MNTFQPLETQHNDRLEGATGVKGMADRGSLYNLHK